MKNSQPSNKEYERVKLFWETFSSAAGKAVLRELRKNFYDVSCHIAGDPYQTAYMEGQRSIVIYIADMLRQSKHPELFSEEIPDDYNE